MYTMLGMARHLTHVITFRVSAAELGPIQALRAAFPEAEYGKAFRWLLEQPEVHDVIERKAGSTERQPTSASFAEHSLPAGDR